MRGAKRSAAEAAMSSITPGAPNSDDDVESSMMADSDNDDNDDPIPITQTSEVLSQSQRSMSLSQSSVMTLSQPSQSQGPGVEGGAASGEGGAPSAKRAKLEV